MPGPEEKNAIHPVFIFKQAWSVCRKNLRQLSAIYLIFNLPIAVISLSPMVRSLPHQKPSLALVLWSLLTMVIGSWGHIALLLGANQAVGAQDYTIGQSIRQAKVFLVKYLALILSITLFIMGNIIVGGISAGVIFALLLRVNTILAVLICLVVIIAVIVSLVYFVLRWSLAGLACVFENTWPIPALKDSFALVKKHINPVVGIFGLMLAMYVACFVPMTSAMVLLGVGRNVGQPNQVGTTIYTILINIVLVPFYTMITVVLYKKLKEVVGAHVYA